MNRLLIKSLSLLAFAGTMITACQEDEIQQAEKETQSLMIPAPTAQRPTLAKPGVGKKFSEVYVMNLVGEENNRYKTIKIRNIKGTICQEWLYEDFREKLFDYSNWPDDVSGTKHGFYYPWEGELSDVPQSDWDELFFSDPELLNNETGFHIPNYTDIKNLEDVLGSTAKVRTVLNIEFDGTYAPFFENDANSWHHLSADFWMNPVDYRVFTNWPNCMDPNKVEGCGVLTHWYANTTEFGDGRWTNYTNDRSLRSNVRLMRTIKKEQW